MLPLYAPLITPFTDQENVDLDMMSRNLEKYEALPLTGYLVNGSSGEADMLSQSERVALVERVSKLSRRPVLAGIVASSVVEAKRQIDSHEDLRIESFLIRTPGYYGGQFDQVDFFHQLADYSRRPIMIYQIPQYTGIKLTGDQLSRIAEHPNVVGIKDSLGDLSLLNEVSWPARFHYFLGASALIQPGVAAGVAGGILALANVVPDHCRKLLDFSVRPDKAEQARQLQQQLIPLNRALGGSRGFGLAGLKEACRLVGFEVGRLRSPLKPLPSGGTEQLQALLERLPNLQ